VGTSSSGTRSATAAAPPSLEAKPLSDHGWAALQLMALEATCKDLRYIAEKHGCEVREAEAAEEVYEGLNMTGYLGPTSLYTFLMTHVQESQQAGLSAGYTTNTFLHLRNRLLADRQEAVHQVPSNWASLARPAQKRPRE
jgi:hypothetical protein